MDEKYKIIGPQTTLTDLVKLAATELIENGLNAFDFDIHGVGPDGPMVIHFEATIQKIGTS